MVRLIYMKEGFGWTTAQGVNFTELHPFQLVEELEIPYLLETGRFEIAEKKDLAKYYKLDIISKGGS